MRKKESIFDRLEDRVRIYLSHRPILYACVGAVGVVLIWKGVWETAELFDILWGPGSLILGTLICLISGLLVSFFIGDSIIISGFKREKKLAEKTEQEIQEEAASLIAIAREIREIRQDVEGIKRSLAE